MSVLIRKMRVDDTENIRRFHKRSWLDTYPNEEAGITYEFIDKWTDQWLTPENLAGSVVWNNRIIDDGDNQWYRVVVRGGEVMGLAHAALKDEEGNQHLNAIYIDKSLQGKGVAAQLMWMLFNGFFDKTKDVWLEVVVYNKRAIRFYEKWGFEVVPGSDFMFKDILPTIKMVRKGEAA